MSDFEIRPYAYTEEDAAKLAVMWNESDGQWPGTFTEGVPLTTERVREWMDRETGLAMLVVDDPTRERIVGYGSLWEEHDKANVCYVSLLNVHPAYQGKSLARRMLSQMIDQATELGFHQMDIETWPGNLKSVPLYKKVGFFWAPDTNVHMENFVPLIRQMPIAQNYFQKHAWYTTFRRELLQVEDDDRNGAMKVYRYHWEEDGDKLLVLVDREAKAVTGVETEDLAAYAELDKVEPAQGLPYPICWRVINKQDAPVNVSILVSGDPGVQISHRSAFVLEGGEERVVEDRFTISPDIKSVKKNWPSPRINTMLVVGSDVVELGTGVRSRPAIEISAEPSHPVLMPGQPSKIYIQLRNHLDRAVDGIVSLTPTTGLTADWKGLRHEFNLEAQGYAGLPLTVTCEATGAVPLHFRASFDVEQGTIHTRQERIPIFSLPPGGIASDIGHRGDEGTVILIENEFLRLNCQAEGGRCVVWDKVNNRPISSIREELGPPFVPSELWFRAYDLSLEHSDGWVKATLRARSNNFPGLVLTKEIAVSPSPLMTLRYRLVNEGAKQHTVQLNPRLWLGDRENARITLPRIERLIQERAALFSSTQGDVPEKPEEMLENWLAWRIDDFTVGLIWDDNIEEHKWDWSALTFNQPSITLEPGTTAETPPLYIYAGPGDWADVRRTWYRLMGKTPQQSHTQRAQPRPGRKLEFGFDPSPVFGLSDHVEATLRVDSVREQTLNGRITVDAPDGWQVEPAAFALQDLKREQPLVAQVRFLSQGARAGAFTGRLHVATQHFDAKEPFTLIRLGDEKTAVRVEEGMVGQQPVYTLDNGQSRWQIAPDYHAGVVGWHSGEGDVNHLKCAFPQEGGATMGWLKPWFGGIQPTLVPSDFEQEGWPGKLHEETFTAQRCECADERGINWHGLRLSAPITRKRFRGIQANIEYLTVGKSNLLKIVYRLVNETGIYRKARPGLLAFCQVDGRYDNATLHGPGMQRKRTQIMTWTVVKPWGAVTNPESERTLVMVQGTLQADLELSDWGQDGGHVLCQQHTVIPPHSQREMIVYLALTYSLEEAQRYATLGAQSTDGPQTGI